MKCKLSAASVRMEEAGHLWRVVKNEIAKPFQRLPPGLQLPHALGGVDASFIAKGTQHAQRARVAFVDSVPVCLTCVV